MKKSMYALIESGIGTQRVQRGSTLCATANTAYPVTINEVDPNYASLNITGWSSTSGNIQCRILSATQIELKSSVASTTIFWEVRG